MFAVREGKGTSRLQTSHSGSPSWIHSPSCLNQVVTLPEQFCSEPKSGILTGMLNLHSASEVFARHLFFGSTPLITRGDFHAASCECLRITGRNAKIICHGSQLQASKLYLLSLQHFVTDSTLVASRYSYFRLSFAEFVRGNGLAEILYVYDWPINKNKF
jgi:hypothetical protein